MWYQLYIDYKKVEYKISKVKKSLNWFLEKLEEKSKTDSTICYETRRYNDNYYVSKNCTFS